MNQVICIFLHINQDYEQLFRILYLILIICGIIYGIDAHEALRGSS